MSAKITVLLVDDHALVRSAFRRVIEDDPAITVVGEAGDGVEVLAELDGRPVLAREGRILVASFHPELTGDTRVHEMFLKLVEEEAHVRA